MITKQQVNQLKNRARAIELQFAYLTVLIAVCCSCELREIENVFTESYVLTYYECDSVIIQENREKFIISLKKANVLNIHSKGAEKTRYDGIRKKHNDLTYNRITKMWNISALTREDNFFPAVDITRVDVVGNAYFDENHPAGSSLNDIVTIVGVSPKEFINSGYQSRFDWANSTSESFRKIYPSFLVELSKAKPNPDDNPDSQVEDYYPDYYPIEKKLADLNPDDLVLSRIPTARYPYYDICYLVFGQAPTAAESVEMTVSVTMSDGRVFSQVITKHF